MQARHTDTYWRQGNKHTKPSWKLFIPLKSQSVIRETLDTTPIPTLLNQNKVYGKICTGVCGFNVTWQYCTMNRSDLRQTPPTQH